MIKKNHKTYSLSDLAEGNTKMVDPHINPDKNTYDDEFELGIDRKLHVGNSGTGRRWMVDTYKQSTGKHKTPQLKEQLRKIIKEVFAEIRGIK